MRNEDKTKEQLIDELLELRREIAELEASEADVARGVGIGEILIEKGYITSSQLQRAVEKQKETGILGHKRLCEIMIESGFITEEERDSALAEQQGRLRRRTKSA